MRHWVGAESAGRCWKAQFGLPARALEQAHHGQYNPLVNLIGRAVEAGLDMFLEACAAVPDELQRRLRDVARRQKGAERSD